MAKTIKHLAVKLRVAHLCANLSYAALLGVLTAWILLRDAGVAPLLWVLVCLPLLILWPAMRRKHFRAYSWLCFVILLYFIKAVEGSLSSVASWVDYSVLALSIIIFISAMLTSRWMQYARAQQSSPAEVSIKDTDQ